jgi:hypothetical protein
VVPGAYDNRLGEGDLIALQLDREDLDGVDDPVREWYSVTSLSAGREGRIILDLEHFPVDSQGRSLVALDVANATAAGDLFITGDTGPSCDEDPSRATDTSIPAEDALSRTKEEVYFYNKNGRFPNNNEYTPQPNPPQKPQNPSSSGNGGGGGGGGGSTVGNGGIGGSALPPSKTASTANNPYGPPNWPKDLTGAPVDGKPLQQTPPKPTTTAYWYAVVAWESNVDGNYVLEEHGLATISPGGGYCSIEGFSPVPGQPKSISFNVTTSSGTSTLSFGPPNINIATYYSLTGSGLYYRDPDADPSIPQLVDSYGFDTFQ